MDSLVTSKPLTTNESLAMFSHSNNATLTSSIRVFYPFVLFMSMLSSGDAFGRCFNTEKGLSIEGSEYRRLRNINHRSCALECRDDPSCFAYEWLEASALCFLKARSLSGDLVRKADAIIGFCLDDEDEERDRFRDHAAFGPELVSVKDVEGEKCKDTCMVVREAAAYSWTPNDLDDDDAVVGTCKCIESLMSVKLDFNSFSGFLGPRKWLSRERRHSPL
ncbi:Apple domain-containing protein [Trichostrongylus colubriformis]|uniref:Apple domain-containing protein n=1 Tax=Trichostrongylus colubriformis TaxID=6319 RepID=A0AAN8J3Q9_TRICO